MNTVECNTAKIDYDEAIKPYCMTPWHISRGRNTILPSSAIQCDNTARGTLM